MADPADSRPQHDIAAVGRAFGAGGRLIQAARHGSGHINDTYLALYDGGGRTVRYVHQRINHLIFKDPPKVMENIHRVTEHQRRKLAGAPAAGPPRQALTCLPAPDGRPFWRDAEGNTWRTYVFIENARSYDVVESTRQAFVAARAFGEFQKVLADLPSPRLHETIPDFHNTPRRIATLEATVAADTLGRADACRAEIDHALSQRASARRLTELQAEGSIPERITHNDTKLNNVMLDEVTGEDVCVIDLDTVMPGLALYDFGDMVRTATMPVKEDEQDLSRVIMQWTMFEALAEGYLSSAGAFLNAKERANLAFAGWLMTFEVGVRFLTDHLAGDTYFRIRRPGQNLDRCRAQFALARDIERNLPAMERLIAAI
jgi:Phosphotransferase enzyme family